MRLATFAVYVALGAVPTTGASAQAPDQATVYSRGHFEGSKRVFTGPVQGIKPALSVRSLQLSPGSEWEMCTGNSFTGCRVVRQSDEATVMTVRSARPARTAAAAAAAASAAAAVYSAGGAYPGPSLRGVASEYFAAPQEDGQRLKLKPETSGQDQANEFCKSRGWSAAAHSMIQQDGGQSWLADVLCQ